MELQYLKHNEIDYAKWDAALNNCKHRLIYAESIYLNCLATTWDAIVNEDWTCIMPIPVRKKFGFKYVPTTPFIQQLGIFSSANIDSSIIEAFTIVLKKKYWRIDYNFNYDNKMVEGICNNYILQLNKTEKEIALGYKNDLKKDLKKNTTLVINHHRNYENAVALFFATYKHRLTLLNSNYQKGLLQLCKYYKEHNRLMVYEAKANDNTVAIALFFMDEKRIYNLASTITNEGKKLSANHHLYNEIIKAYAETNFTLDFEGSDIVGIASFYKQFGAINEPYNKLTFNRI